jgi:hypothetical protein
MGSRNYRELAEVWVLLHELEARIERIEALLNDLRLLIYSVVYDWCRDN